MDKIFIPKNNNLYKAFWNDLYNKLNHSPTGYEIDEALREYNSEFEINKTSKPDYTLGFYLEEKDYIVFRLKYE